MNQENKLLARLARWSVAHRRLIVALWVLVAAAAVISNSRVGGEFRNDLSVPDAETQKAFDLLRERFPQYAGDGMQVVLHATEGSLDDPEVMAAVTDASEEMAQVDGVTSARAPYGPPPRTMSADSTTGFIAVQFDQRSNSIPATSITAVRDAARPISDLGVQVEFGGPAMQTENRPSGSEILGLVAAVVVLLLAFGSVFAMAIPLADAVLALAVGISIVGLVSRLVTIGTAGPVVAAMIGLGVGIDYALLIVTRHRENMAKGITAADSIPLALATAGRSVLVAGSTVIVAILALYLIGIDFVASIGLASAITVAVTLVAAVTLLPAMLGFAGNSLDRWKISLLHHRHSGQDTWWHRWTASVQRHRWAALILSSIILIVLALPVLSMRLGSADAGSNPTDSTTRKAYDLIADGFGPGFNGPLMLVVELSGSPEQNQQSLDSLVKAVRSTPDVAAATPPTINPAGDTAVITVVPASSPQDERTEALVHGLRNDVIPAAVDTKIAEVSVGGQTAMAIDLADRIGQRLPIFMVGIIGASFILLMVEFRSLFVPLKAALMNLLSIGAAYGAVVAVFQWGWLSGLFGTSTGPIESFAPMMLFAVLFGLSMDYEVFLLSRVHEEYVRTGDNSLAVREGMASTARVITAAASVMIVVFLSFMLNEQRVVNLFGFGLAFAILVDASIVRLILVPASMDLAGRVNWWFPGRRHAKATDEDPRGELGSQPDAPRSGGHGPLDAHSGSR